MITLWVKKATGSHLRGTPVSPETPPSGHLAVDVGRGTVLRCYSVRSGLSNDKLLFGVVFAQVDAGVRTPEWYSEQDIMDQIAFPSAGASGVGKLAKRLAELRGEGVHIVGLTGSVASGKSTLAAHLVEALAPACRAQTISTDGFLFSNAELERRGLLDRKGFPETYDRAGMARALKDLRTGPAFFPGYSHDIYDVDPALGRTLPPPDVLILEGLGHVAPSPGPRGDSEPDLLVYLDAAPDDLEAWYVERFRRLWNAAEHDPTSFYARFRHMSPAELEAFARQVWREINLPNLTDHIAPLRAAADLVVAKRADHSLVVMEDRTV
jgi:type I pantothenate kinase